LPQGAHTTQHQGICVSGACIINAEGYCWCGQKWDGDKMCFPELPLNEVQAWDILDQEKDTPQPVA